MSYRVAWSHVRIARVNDTAMAFFGTLVGAALTGVFQSSMGDAVAVAASNACLSAASMMANDWHDVEADRINCPSRPIPAGHVSRSRALTMAVLGFALGVLCASLAGPGFAWRAVSIVALSLAYTAWIKRVPVLGHVLIGSLSSYPLWCWAFDGVLNAPFAALVAAYFVGTIGKEIVRTAADAPGDAAVGIRTIATMFGATRANAIGAITITISMAIAAIPAFRRETGPAFALVTVLASLAIGYFAWMLMREPGSRNTSRRIVSIARAVTVLMAAALTWDLIVASGR